MIYTGGVCDQLEQNECLEQFGEEWLAWACGECEKKRAEDISDWTFHILELRKLHKAGYPFRPNDLSLEEWEDLGTANMTIEIIEKKMELKSSLIR